MDPFVYLIALFLVILFIAVLPLISGVASYKYEKTNRIDQSKKDEDEVDYSQGYLSPEERAELDAKAKSNDSRFSKIKQLSNVSKNDIPLKFRPKFDNSNANIRNRKTKTEEVDHDPSTYDFDIDEFIASENKEDAEEKAREDQEALYKGENVQEMA